MNRGTTLLLAGGLLVGMVVVASFLPVPYVVFSPGPTADVLGEVNGEPVISADGARTYPTDGQLDLTTVAVTPAAADLGLVQAVTAWIDPDQAVLPRSVVYPEGRTADEVDQVNATLWTGSQDAAKAAALTYLGYEVDETRHPVVTDVMPGSPAEGKLEHGDLIMAVDGTSVTRSAEVVEAVSAHEPGEQVTFRVRRDDKAQNVTVTTVASEDDASRAVVQVGVSEVITGYDFPVDVQINAPEDIGGSSAGLIFALGVVDRLTAEDLLDGGHAAGTGEIDPDGNVRPISGIAQKIVGAADGGAVLFLAPKANCAEVLTVDAPIPVVPVETLSEAVDVVTEAAETGEAPDISCDTAAAS